MLADETPPPPVAVVPAVVDATASDVAVSIVAASTKEQEKTSSATAEPVAAIDAAVDVSNGKHADSVSPAKITSEVAAPSQSSASETASVSSTAANAKAAGSSNVIEVTDSDSLDGDIDDIIIPETAITAEAATTETTPSQEDALIREMEEIEGTIESSTSVAADDVEPAESVAVVSVAAKAVVPKLSSPAKGSATNAKPSDDTTVPKKATSSVQQETSDLLKDLEHGGVAETVTGAGATAATVDSTSSAAKVSAQKCTHSEVIPTEAAVTAAKKSAISAATVEIIDDDDSDDVVEVPMEVDAAKDEAITSSTSSVPATAAAKNEASSKDTSGAVSSTSLAVILDKSAVEAMETDDLDASVAKATAQEPSGNLDRTLATPVLPATSTIVADNKLLTNLMKNGNSSTPNSNPASAAATPNVFNSTPIQRQFDISSENVSKIDGAISTDTSTVNKSTTVATAASTTTNNTTTTASASAVQTSSSVASSASSSLLASSTATEPEPQQSSSDNLTHYAKVLKQFNGLGDSAATTPTPNSASAGSSASQQNTPAPAVSLSNGIQLDETNAVRDNSTYEISVWYEQSDIVALHVERKSATTASNTATDDSTAASAGGASNATHSINASSNGSVSSVGPFALPAQTAAAAVAAANSIDSSTGSTGAGGDTLKLTVPPSSIAATQQPRIRDQVHGVLALANYMIEHFTAVRREFGGAEEPASIAATTPVAAGGRKAAAKKNLARTGATAARSPDVKGSPDVQSPSTPSRGSVAATAAASRRNKRAAAPSTPSNEEEPSAKKVRLLFRNSFVCSAPCILRSTARN